MTLPNQRDRLSVDRVEVTVHEAKTHLSRLLSEQRTIWGDLDGNLPDDFDAPLDDFADHS